MTVNVPADLVYNNGGPKNITSSAIVDNLAGPDPNGSNDSASATTRVVAVADLKITNFTAMNPPDQIVIGQTLNVTMRKTIANGGPSSPMDATLTKTASASSGASVSPTSSTSDMTALAVGSPQTMEETFTIGCSQPGFHTYTFTNEIRPSKAEDTDPDFSNNTAQVQITLDCLVPVAINVKPGSNPNTISLKVDKVVTVAVLTTRVGEYGLPLAFDASTIQPLTVRFGQRTAVPTGTSTSAEIHKRGHLEDAFELGTIEHVRDGDLDMVLHFPVSGSQLTVSNTEACVKGSFVDAGTGMTFRFFGCDAVRVIP